MIGAEGVQVLHPLQNIGKVAQGVLGRLRGGIGTAGEGAEGGHIDEAPLIPPADVQFPHAVLYNVFRGGRRGPWNLEAGGEVVGGSLGEIAQGRRGIQPHQAGDHLVEGAVSSGCHHQIVSGALPGGGIGRVSWGGGLVDPDEVTRAGEDGQRVKQRTVGLVPPGPGIENEQQFLRFQE